MDIWSSKDGENSDKDINEIFDFIAFPEQKISDEEFQKGFTKGKNEGKVDGYHLGYHRGLEIGMEIGFYKGLIKELLENSHRITFKSSEKIFQTVNKLNDLLLRFPSDNSENVDIVSSISEMRIHYKKLTSLLKFKMPFPFSSDMSF